MDFIGTRPDVRNPEITTGDAHRGAVLNEVIRQVLGDYSESPTLTVEQTAGLLGISRTATYEAIRRGQIPGIRIGRRLVVPTPALVALLLGATAAIRSRPEAT